MFFERLEKITKCRCSIMVNALKYHLGDSVRIRHLAQNINVVVICVTSDNRVCFGKTLSVSLIEKKKIVCVG